MAMVSSHCPMLQFVFVLPPTELGKRVQKVVR